MTRVLWELDKVTLSGRGADRLHEVSLEIPAGVTAILGPSGAGKSSLLNLLVAFEQPTRGSFRGVHEASDPESTANQASGLPVFWVPQDHGLWPHANVGEHLAAVCEEAELCERLLDGFELSDVRGALPDTLSAGQRGRLSVARALASQANVLVMDEPLINVSSAAARRYWQLIRECTQDKSIVFASHSLDTVVREADHVICLEDGRLRYAGDKATLYESPPTAELAELLGPINWFDSSEAESWLHRDRDYQEEQDDREEQDTIQDSLPSPSLCRPENLHVQACHESPILVQESRYGLTVGELDVIDERTQRQRTLFHRVTGRRFQSGDRITLRMLLLCFLCVCATVFLTGCTQSDTAPQWQPSAVNHWSMPPAGKIIPAPRSVRYGPNDEVFVLDNGGRVLVFSSTGELQRQWEMPAYDVGKPEGICILKDGRIAVTDTHYHRVVFFDRDGNVLGMHGSHGEGPGEFIYPVAITQDPNENYYVCEYGGNDRVQKFSVTGERLLQFGGFGTEPGQFQRPSGVVWIDGQVFVADAINNRIQVFSDQGEFQRVLAHEDVLPKLYYPYDLVAGSDQQLHLVEYGSGCVTEVSHDGRVLSRWGRIGSAKGNLTTPWGLARSASGTIIVADTGNRRLVEIQP